MPRSLKQSIPARRLTLTIDPLSKDLGCGQRLVAGYPPSPGRNTASRDAACHHVPERTTQVLSEFLNEAFHAVAILVWNADSDALRLGSLHLKRRSFDTILVY